MGPTDALPTASPPTPEPVEPAAGPTPDEDGRVDFPPVSSREVASQFTKVGYVPLRPSESGEPDADQDPGPLVIPPNSSRVITFNIVEGGFVNFHPAEDDD
jgi:hypothetical protein